MGQKVYGKNGDRWYEWDFTANQWSLTKGPRDDETRNYFNLRETDTIRMGLPIILVDGITNPVIFTPTGDMLSNEKAKQFLAASEPV